MTAVTTAVAVQFEAESERRLQTSHEGRASGGFAIREGLAPTKAFQLSAKAWRTLLQTMARALTLEMDRGECTAEDQAVVADILRVVLLCSVHETLRCLSMQVR